MSNQELKINISTIVSDAGLKELENQLKEASKQLIDLKRIFGTKSEWVDAERKGILDLKTEIKDYKSELQKSKKEETDAVKKAVQEQKAEEKKAIAEQRAAQKQAAAEQKAEEKKAIAEQRAAQKQAAAEQKAEEKKVSQEIAAEKKKLIQEEKEAARKALIEKRAFEKQSIAEQKAEEKKQRDEEKKYKNYTGQETVLGSVSGYKEKIDFFKKYREEIDITTKEGKAKFKEINEVIKSAQKNISSVKSPSSAQWLEWGENVVTCLRGAQQFASQIKELSKDLYELGQKGAEFQNLKSHFDELNGGAQKSGQYLEEFRKAASGNLSDSELIKYSNTMLDLGYNTDETTQYLDISERIADNLGITIEEGNSKLLAFIETGRGKGLKTMGLSITEINKEMEKLATQQGVNIKKLDDESAKRLRGDAVLKLYGKSLDEINTKEKDNADKIRSMSTAFENAKEKIGEFVGGVLAKLAEFLGTNAERIATILIISGAVITAIIGISVAIMALIPLIKSVGIETAIATGGITVALGLLAGFISYFATMPSEAEKVDKLTMSLNEQEKAINSLSGEYGNLQNYLDELNRGMALDDETIQKLIQKYPELNGGLDAHTGKVIINTEALQKLIDKKKEELALNEQRAGKTVNELFSETNYEAGLQKIDELRAAQSEYGKQIEDLTNKINALNPSQEKYNAYLSDYTLRIEMAKKVQEGMNRQIKVQYDLNAAATQGIQNFIEKSLESSAASKVLSRNFQDITAEMLKTKTGGYELGNMFQNMAINIGNGLGESKEKFKEFSKWQIEFNDALIRYNELIAQSTLSILGKGPMQLMIEQAKNNVATLLKSGYEKFNASNTKPTRYKETPSSEKSAKETGEKEKEETIQKVISLIEQRIKNAILEKKYTDELIKSQLEYLKLKEALSHAGDTEVERLENEEKYKNELIQLNQRLTAYALAHQKISPTAGVLQPDLDKEQTKRGTIDLSQQMADLAKLQQSKKNFEIMKTIAEEAGKAIQTTAAAVGDLFGAFMKGDNAKDAFKSFLKSVVNTLITSVQAMMFAAKGALAAKGITSFGLTMITDAPLLAAGWVALEVAKGVVGALAGGGPFGPGAYLVGEKGPELMFSGAGGHMMNNRDFNELIAGRMQGKSQAVNNIINLGTDVDWLKVRQASDMKYGKYKNGGRIK